MDSSLPPDLRKSLTNFVKSTSPPDCMNCIHFDMDAFKCKHDVPDRMEIYYEGELCCSKYKPE